VTRWFDGSSDIVLSLYFKDFILKKYMGANCCGYHPGGFGDIGPGYGTIFPRAPYGPLPKAEFGPYLPNEMIAQQAVSPRTLPALPMPPSFNRY
jgi:hypothetical protein